MCEHIQREKRQNGKENIQKMGVKTIQTYQCANTFNNGR